MEINKRNRTELRHFFQKGDQPTEKQFAEFIDAGINQAEDGIAKVQGNPLAIQAEGEAVGTQEILDLYSNFKKDNPDWSLNLNPRVDSQKPDSNQPGLNIKDATGQSRLFIKSGNGNIGVGTVEPSAPLTIKGATHSDKPHHMLQISESSILFGGENANENADSARLKVDEKAFEIYGKTSGGNVSTRKLTVFSEGGMSIKGSLNIDGNLTSKNIKAVAANQDLGNQATSDEKVPTQKAVKTYIDRRLPKGLISMWSGTAIPKGWILCDGTNGTPNLSGRFIVGQDKSNAEYTKIGNTGGLEQVTLTEGQMPSHNHTGETASDGNHRHSFKGATSKGDGPSMRKAHNYYGSLTRVTDFAGAHTHSFETKKTGGDQPHENRPPYFVLAYIMKL